MMTRKVLVNGVQVLACTILLAMQTTIVMQLIWWSQKLHGPQVYMELSLFSLLFGLMLYVFAKMQAYLWFTMQRRFEPNKNKKNP